jgi:hypothetical protein
MHWVSASDLQVVNAEGLVALQHAFSNSQFRGIKIGDLVCRQCRREASRTIAALSSVSIPAQSPQREVLDLLATSPIVARTK